MLPGRLTDKLTCLLPRELTSRLTVARAICLTYSLADPLVAGGAVGVADTRADDRRLVRVGVADPWFVAVTCGAGRPADACGRAVPSR